MNLRFDGQVVAVSGAGHGLGQTIAETFACLGARVFGCYPGPAQVDGVTMAAVDLTDRAAVDVLVNNARSVAGQVFRPVEEVTDADWDGILAVNLGAAFALSRAAAPGIMPCCFSQARWQAPPTARSCR